MGAWSFDSFGNDTACDWAFDLAKTSDLRLVRDAIASILDAGHKYLKASAASEVIAAVEVIARLKGNFGIRNSYSKSIDTWVAEHPQSPPPDLVERAIKALDRVLVAPSELLELWENRKNLRRGKVPFWI